MSQKANVEMIHVPNTLRDKVTRRDDDPIDLNELDKVLAELGAQFVERLPGELQDIEDAFAALREAGGDADSRNRLFRLVHDLKGQAGTFDYHLITVIGNDLCRFLEHSAEMTMPRLMVAGFFIDAMKRVADKKITGDGGEFGMNMINTLHRMTQKVLQGD